MEYAKLVPEICVLNLEKSLGFYVDILGFTIKYDRPEEGFAYLENQGSEIMLEEINPSQRQWITGKLEYPFGRGMNFQMEIDNVDDLYKTVKKHNIPLYLDLEEKWYRTGDNQQSGLKQFNIQDPDGYLLRFFTHIGTRRC